MDKPLQLYINIPFRPAGCDRLPGETQPFDQVVLKAYTIALKREITACGADMDDYTVSSVRIGGCSAPVITTRVLRELMACVRESFSMAPDAYFELDALPAAMNERLCVGMNYDKLDRIRCYLATIHNSEWTALSLPYDYNTSIGSLTSALQNYRPAALTLEILYDIPGQTDRKLATTLNRVLAFAPDSVCLLPAGDNSEARDALYHLAAARLIEAGYHRVSLQEFSLPGREDRFTSDTMRGIDRLGIGLGARSCYDGVSYHNTSDLNLYLDNSDAPEVIAEDIIAFDEQAAAGRNALLALSSPAGLAIHAVPDALTAQLGTLRAKGYIAEENGILALTEKGLAAGEDILRQAE